MAYSAFAVANAFISKATDGKLQGLTPMKLQKLMFYAQSWHLLLKDQQPLFDDFFARWQYGPVIPSLYHELKEYGSNEIKGPTTTFKVTDTGFTLVAPEVPHSDQGTWQLIDKIIEVYGKFTGPQLSNMTHQQGGAWFETGKGDGGVLSNDDLFKYIQPKKVAG
jgi:uncharacterized phage-associated protein